MILLSKRIDDAGFAEANQYAVDLRSSMALRSRFREHLKKVARALQAIELNDGWAGDWREETLIKEVLG